MAKYIIDGKLYDTDNAEVFLEFISAYGIPTVIYRTKKGNWFSVRDIGTKKEARFENEYTLRTSIGDLNDVNLYNNLFGILEEM